MSDPLRVMVHDRDTGALERRLAEAFPQVEVTACTSYASLPEAIATHRPDVLYSVRFAGTPGFAAEAIFTSGGPRWVSNGGVGTDHFGQWDSDRTTVTNAAGVGADAMADYVIGGFLHFSLDVPGLQQDKRARVWRDREVSPLRGKTLLIIGLGHTGRAIALRAKAFGMTVIGTRARPEPTAHVDEVFAATTLDTLLPRADCIAICTPLVPATRSLVAAPQFARMKPGVLLADVSRGGVMDQQALLAALSDGRVAGAALDVFEEEPLPPENPLWSVENLLISPHCSSVFAGWGDASFEIFLANLGRFLKREPLQNVVDPGRGY